MRILVCGGRTYKNYDKVAKTLYALFPPTTSDIATWLPPSGTVVIHGDANGADSLADQWAVVNWVKVERYPANWKKYGKIAGPIRNNQMLVEGKPDLVIAFPGGRGTDNMCQLAERTGVEVRRIE